MTSTGSLFEASGKSPREAFEAFDNAYSAAAERTGTRVRTIDLAGHAIRLEFAGEALEHVFMRPLAHLLPAPTDAVPALTIRVWDSATSGMRVPFPVDVVEGFRAGGFPSAAPESGVLVSYGRPSPGLAMLDLESRTAVYAIPSALQPPYSDVGGPFGSILNWWATRNGYLWVHGGVVGTPDGAAIITGPSGFGKSTTCLACLQAGMLFVGDDYCLLRDEGETVTASSLYNTGKVRFANFARLPGLGQYVVRPEDPLAEKGMIFASEVMPAQVRRSLQVRAIVFPEAKGRDVPSTRPLAPARTLAALAPSSLLQLSSGSRESLSGFAAVTRRIPGFAIALAGDTSRNPPAIEQIIRDVARQ